MKLDSWLEKNHHKWWWVKDVKNLDEEAVVEGVMNYGRWKDFLYIKNELGLKKIGRIFNYMTRVKKRVNLRPERVALFGNYLKRYARD